VDIVKNTDKSAVLRFFGREEDVAIDDGDNSSVERERRSSAKKSKRGEETSRRSSTGEDRSKERRRRDKEGSSGRKRERGSSSRDKERDHRRSKEKDRKHKRQRPSSSQSHVTEESVGTDAAAAIPRKREKGPMTQDQLFQNLKTVVDKRTGAGEDMYSTQPVDMEEDEVMGSTNDAQEEEGEMVDKPGMIPRRTDKTPLPPPQQPKHTPSTKPKQQPNLIYNTEEDERRAITECLSCIGYEADQISTEVLENDVIAVTKIMGLEIPVGDSASILRCGAPSATGIANGGGVGVGGGGSTPSKGNKNGGAGLAGGEGGTRDFTRVLDLYNEALKTERMLLQAAKNPRRSKPSKKTTNNNDSSTTEPKGKPIIIVPNAMTSPVTLINAHEFFQNAIFQSRQTMLQKNKNMGDANYRRNQLTTITHSISTRLGGGTLEYELMDNPAIKLKTKDDWDRVVAVVAQGAAWQFKGWKMGKSSWSKGSGAGGGAAANPVDVFANAFGFYVGYEGTPLPKDLQGWSVKKGIVSRDKRGFDSVVLASFWNGLDEWMSVHKRDYLPKVGGE